MVQTSNLLFILSDEHRRDTAGCYGDPIARTPNIDSIAARGSRFLSAYTPSPICVPARAALATGRWVHQTGAWDNAAPYAGKPISWHRRLRDNGHRAVSIGKLHFRATEDDNGFSEEILPLHVLEGKGDLIGMLREPPAPRGSLPALAASAGPGESHYNDYDRAITAAACRWIATEGRRAGDKPWALFVSLVRPHFPLTAPPEFYALYPPERMPIPRLYSKDARPKHPAVAALASVMNYDDFFDDEPAVRRAVASYYALVSFLDDNVGKILTALETAGLTASTRVIYTSDHGDNLGCRGLWGKSVMYEESAAIPLLMAGADIPAGWTIRTPVSLVDCYRTILDAVGCPLSEADEGLPSRSLLETIAGKSSRDVLSEYHAAGSITGSFMIRRGRWKYIHHVGFRPELYDLDADPGETTDLAARPDKEPVLAECRAALQRICDPDAVNAEAFADQRRRIALHGGRDAVMRFGDFSYTPAPGENPVRVAG